MSRRSLRKTVFLCVLVIVGVFVSSGSVDAGTVLAGDSINVKYCLPNTSDVWEDVGTATVPATFVYGITRYGQEDFRVIVSDTTIVLDWSNTHFGPNDVFSSLSFTGIVLTDLTKAPITSVAIDPSTTNLAGLNASRIFSDGNHVTVNLQGLTAHADTIVQLDLNAASAVPLPAAAGSGLVVLGGLALRQLRMSRRDK